MMRILIVEDSAPLRRMMRALLAPLTAEIFECGDGAEAFAAYRRHRPDWVLMDWQMKRMDGLTATRRIKDAFPDAHILFVTQYDDHELRQAARAAGACGYVLKDDLLGLRSLLREEIEP